MRRPRAAIVTVAVALAACGAAAPGAARVAEMDRVLCTLSATRGHSLPKLVELLDADPGLVEASAIKLIRGDDRLCAGNSAYVLGLAATPTAIDELRRRLVTLRGDPHLLGKQAWAVDGVLVSLGIAAGRTRSNTRQRALVELLISAAHREWWPPRVERPSIENGQPTLGRFRAPAGAAATALTFTGHPTALAFLAMSLAATRAERVARFGWEMRRHIEVCVWFFEWRSRNGILTLPDKLPDEFVEQDGIQLSH